MLKAILFDHDGTTVDSEQAHYTMWRDVLRDYKIALTADEYTRHYAGVPTPALSEVLAEKYSLAVEPKVLYAAKMDATNRYLANQAYPLMAGAREAMQFFHERGLAIAVVTGSARGGVDSTIQRHGLDAYVSAVVSRDDVAKTKPAPDCYLLAAERLGLQPADCLAIEDTYNGSLAAFRAEIKCIGVSSAAPARDQFANAIYACRSLDEARVWISANLLTPASQSNPLP
jgi:HAD superfamily hydrolase (TIGR01509 family)